MVRKALGNMFMDLGKLSFGSLILGAVLRGDFGPYQLLFIGIIGSAILFGIGLIIMAKIKE